MGGVFWLAVITSCTPDACLTHAITATTEHACVVQTIQHLDWLNAFGARNAPIAIEVEMQDCTAVPLQLPAPAVPPALLPEYRS